MYYPIDFDGLVIAANILALVRSPGQILTPTNTIEISVNYLYLGLYDVLFLFLCLNKIIS